MVNKIAEGWEEPAENKLSVHVFVSTQIYKNEKIELIFPITFSLPPRSHLLGIMFSLLILKAQKPFELEQHSKDSQGSPWEY